MDLLTAWYEASTAGLGDMDVWDAHTHTGSNDPDGVVGTAPALLDALDDAGHTGAVVMPSVEPGGYPPANDRVLAEAAEADGRLIPFCRVDPKLGREALVELERCTRLGFAGIKLHPRGENFSLALPIMRDVAALAADAGWPILIHAGRGIPSLVDDVERLLDAHPDLNMILAHGGISDLGVFATRHVRHPGMFFDTAWRNAASLLAVGSRIPPDRLVYASDTPYGQPLMSAAMLVRVGRAVGYGADAFADVMGGNLRTLLGGKRPVPGWQPRVADSFDPLLIAAYSDLEAGIVQILSGRSGEEALQLASRACTVDDDHEHAALLRAVATTIDVADTATPDRRTAIRALVVASAALLTPRVAVPEL